MKTDTSHSDDPTCYSDFALQEYALGRFSKDVRGTIASHLEGCSACTRALNEIQLEVCYFQELGEIRSETSGACVTDENLASIIDAGIDDKTHEHIVVHLQSCSDCRQRLVEMRQEIVRALSQSEGSIAEERSEASQVLTIPKRPEQPDTEQVDLPKFGIKDVDTGT